MGTTNAVACQPEATEAVVTPPSIVGKVRGLRRGSSFFSGEDRRFLVTGLNRIDGAPPTVSLKGIDMQGIEFNNVPIRDVYEDLS